MEVFLVRRQTVPLLLSMIVGSVVSSTSPVWAAGPPEPTDGGPTVIAEELAAAVKIGKDYDEMQQSLDDKFRAGSSDAERDAIQRSLDGAASDYRERTRQAARRLLDLARNRPADPTAIDVLVWVASHASEPERGTAMDMLIRDHLDSDKLGWSVCWSLGWSGRENDLRQLMAHSAHKIVRAFAAYELAGNLRRQVEANPSHRERLAPEIDALLEQIVDDYADIEHPSWKRTLGELAGNEVFERRHLVVGKTAPAIEGVDMEGRPLKLTDYRGKVVLLDFWGFG